MQEEIRAGLVKIKQRVGHMQAQARSVTARVDVLHSLMQAVKRVAVYQVYCTSQSCVKCPGLDMEKQKFKGVYWSRCSQL